jgi:hypothetical protein
MRGKEMKLENFSTIVDKMIAYESCELNEEEVVEFFQELVDRRLIDSLQGSYQRTAALLLELGHIEQREE